MPARPRPAGEVTDEVMAAIQALSGQESAEQYNESPKAA